MQFTRNAFTRKTGTRENKRRHIRFVRSSSVIEHIIAVNRVLGRTQFAQIFTNCLQSLDIRLNYYFTLNEQRTELHNNKS